MIDPKNLSFASTEKNYLLRRWIQLVERLTFGKQRWDHLNNIFQRSHDNIFQELLDLFGITAHITSTTLANIPQTGATIVICNHPFGIADSLLMGKMVSTVRKDCKILSNTVFKRLPLQLLNYLLPLNLNPMSPADHQHNARELKKAMAHIRQGGLLVIFPAGKVSTSPNLFSPAVDDSWSELPASIALKYKCPVVPVFFHGQNSFLFQLVSKIHIKLRKALFVSEALRLGRKKAPVKVTVFTGLQYADYQAITDKTELTAYFRAQVYRELSEG